LPKPKRHSNPPFQFLESLLNLPDPAAFRRLLAWTVTALRPAGPYPILILAGPPSSGKSTTARILRNLIDPSATPLHALPRTERDLFFLAIHNRVLAFDHVPRIPREMSTTLARIAAGTAFAQQGPSPFDQSLQFAIERPVIVTVPSVDSAAADWARNRTIANLALTLQLEAIPSNRMRPPADLAAELETITPYLVADLCNAVSTNLAGNNEELEAALLPDPIVKVIKAHLEQNGPFTGTATELYTILEARAPATLPADPRALSEKLNKTPLAIYGIEAKHERTESERLLKLSLTHDSFSASFEPETCVMT
jgi:hypothetical protein